MARSRQSLEKECDRLFSLHVRNRGSQWGWNHCFTCGAYKPIEELQAGHFIPRRYHNVRWHPLNVWPQCNNCNVNLSGNLEIYEKKLVAQYSALAIEALWDLARTNDGITDYEMREIINNLK